MYISIYTVRKFAYLPSFYILLSLDPNAYLQNSGLGELRMDRQEQLRLERERRQARIKAAGANRLAKITGTAGTQDFKEPVKTEPLKAVSTPSQSSDQLNTPTPPKPSNSDSTITPESPEAQITPKGSPNLLPNDANPSKNTVSTSASASASQEPFDPFSAFLQAAGGNGEFDMSKLAAAFGQQPPQTEKDAVQQQTNQQNNQQQYQQQHQPRRTEKTDFAWDFIHIVGAIGVGLYAALANPWNTTLVFVTLQVLQLATQVLLGQASTGLPGFVSPFVAMLPRNRQRQVYTAGGFLSALYTAYRDFSVSLVVFGAFSLGGRDFARPL